tara:strand:+ start:36 stop:347 length:312 start_codon:yes stop_codon:yes gene_type:complete
MKQTINFYDFRQAFQQHGRENQFSHEGLSTLFDMLEEYEQDIDKELELDVIALCCDFSEYDSFEELTEAYDCIKYEDGGCSESLDYYTWWRKTETNGYIIQNF